MSIAGISAIQSALTAQSLLGQSMAHRSHGVPANAQQTSSASSSTSISPLTSLMNALTSSSSTALSTVSSLMNSLPGFSGPSGSQGTNILV